MCPLGKHFSTILMIMCGYLNFVSITIDFVMIEILKSVIYDAKFVKFHNFHFVPS